MAVCGEYRKIKGHKFGNHSSLHMQLFVGWQSRMCSLSEWGWCPAKRLFSAESWGGAFWPLASAHCHVCSWGRIDPGKGGPLSADVGSICQVNELFIRVTAGYSVVKTGGEASWPASLNIGEHCTRHTFKESNDAAHNQMLSALWEFLQYFLTGSRGKPGFLVEIQSLKCHLLNHE